MDKILSDIRKTKHKGRRARSARKHDEAMEELADLRQELSTYV